MTLRALTDSDTAALYEIYGDPQVMRYTDEAPFSDIQTVSLMLESVRALHLSRKSYEWAIVANVNGSVIGTCGLHNFQRPRLSAEVGCLLKREHWGEGYMHEALTLLAVYASEQLGLRCLLADVARENRQAQRLFQKLGYERDEQGLLLHQL